MLEDLKSGRQKYGLKQYLQRRLRGKINRIFFNSTLDDLVAAFRDVGAQEGMTICVHSSLSRLGHIDGGANTIIDALQAVVGENGCLLMPAFSMGGNMASHLRNADVFDSRNTPSFVGLIPETFRRRQGVERSCHPTNSVSAWGSGTTDLLHGHEDSKTPFGRETPYGRLASRDDAYILMLDTHLHSFLHHLQERVGFPNLFLPDETEASIIDSAGNARSMTTKVMRPRAPYFVAIPPASGQEPDWAILHDYAMMFPSRRQAEVRRMGYEFAGFPALHRRRSDLEAAQILRSRKLGRGEIGLLHIRPFLDRIQPELEKLIERYRQYYDPDSIEAMNLPYT